MDIIKSVELSDEDCKMFERVFKMADKIQSEFCTEYAVMDVIEKIYEQSNGDYVGNYTCPKNIKM